MSRTTVALVLGVLAIGVEGAGAQITVPTTPPPKTRAGGSITTKAPTGPTPRKANGQPDLTGVWLRRAGVANIADLLPKGEALPFRRETLVRMSQLKSESDPQLRCLPLAPPRSSPYPFRLVETPGRVFILTESPHAFQIGRAHV